jgi:fructoselysine-6-P-deglycase FrlB-like protein
MVVFASPGRSLSNSLALAEELHGYGVRVLLVQNGCTRELDEQEIQPIVWDEFLSPILDVIPTQLYAEALARYLGQRSGFRYLSKVATKL